MSYAAHRGLAQPLPARPRTDAAETCVVGPYRQTQGATLSLAAVSSYGDTGRCQGAKLSLAAVCSYGDIGRCQGATLSPAAAAATAILATVREQSCH
jgi:hypothetical protein